MEHQIFFHLMNIALITKSKKEISLKLFDENLKELIAEQFQDTYTLNFFLQMIPKKYNISKTLIILNDLERLKDINDNNDNNNIELMLAKDDNSYFINDHNTTTANNQ
jgi:hypothetical protein